MIRKKEIRIGVSEEVLFTGDSSDIHVRVDSRDVRIPISRELKAYFKEQFVRSSPSRAQRGRWATLMNLLRAAYRKGRNDGCTT